MGQNDRVFRGQQLDGLPGDTWNWLIDQAKAQQAAQAVQFNPPAPIGADPDYIWVQNDSGADVARFGILGIDGVIISPATSGGNPAEFKNTPNLAGVEPDTDDHIGKFVICVDGIPDGRIGRALLTGHTAVQIDMTDATHTRADVKDGDPDKLASGTTGAAQILYVESGTGTKWAYVRVGAPGVSEWGFNNRDDYSSNTTWTVPAGTTRAMAVITGGGGGGGGGAGCDTHDQLLTDDTPEWNMEGDGGGGGAGGGAAIVWFRPVPGEDIDITVGTGGAGGSANATTGDGSDGAGGNNSDIQHASTVSKLGYAAYGGGGGKKGYGPHTSQARGGLGGQPVGGGSVFGATNGGTWVSHLVLLPSSGGSNGNPGGFVLSGWQAAGKGGIGGQSGGGESAGSGGAGGEGKSNDGTAAVAGSAGGAGVVRIYYD